MKNILIIAVTGGIIGIIAGYLIFGRIMGEYVSIQALFSTEGGALGDVFRSVSGIKEMRQNILFTGLGGVILGALAGFFIRKR